jgi:hypothetical protein
MKIVAAVLCLALAPSWSRAARAEEAGPVDDRPVDVRPVADRPVDVRSAADRPADVRPTFGGLEPAANALETYRLNALEIVHERMSGSFPTIFVGRSNWWRPVRGKFRYSTSYDDFFLKLGRDDLGARDRHRRVASDTLFWGGVLVSVGGLVVMLSGLSAHHDTRAEVGVGMFGGGFVMTTIGSRIQPPLVSDEDADRMANEYNRRLRVYLGLPPVAVDGGREQRPFGLSVGSHW